MRALHVYAAITDLDEDIILDALPAAASPVSKAARLRAKGAAASRFFERGWVIAALCLLVSGAVLFGVIWMGGHAPVGPAESGESRVESPPDIMEDFDPQYDLTVQVSSGGLYHIPNEIFLGGTFYEKEAYSYGPNGEIQQPTTFEYEGSPLPDAEDIRTLAPTLLPDPVRTVFAEDTLRLLPIALTRVLQVYNDRFEPLALPANEFPLDELAAGTYYVVVEVEKQYGTMNLAGRGDEYTIQSVRYAYTFALIKQDFWASYPGASATITVDTPTGKADIEALYRHGVTLRTKGPDGKTVEYKQPYKTLEPEEVLAMKEMFEKTTIRAYQEPDLQLRDGCIGQTAVSSSTLYDAQTGEFLVSGSFGGEYVDEECYMLLRYWLHGGTHTVGDITYEVEFYYEFPMHYTVSQDYSDKVPKLWLGAGEDYLLPMHQYPWEYYSAELVRQRASTELPLYAERLWERPVTVSPDTPLTITLPDSETSLREVCVYDTSFTEITAGADVSCVGTLPAGDYYVVLAVEAKGHGKRNPMNRPTYCHLYFASVRVAASGGGLELPTASQQIIQIHTGQMIGNKVQTYLLTDNLRHAYFDAHVTGDAMKNVPKTLSDELRALADLRADTPVVMESNENEAILYISKPINPLWLYSVAIYNESGELVVGDASDKHFLMSDWEGVWGITHMFYDLAPGRYYAVIKLDLPEDPSEEKVYGYDYPFVFVKE